jgi:hypothetical protein
MLRITFRTLAAVVLLSVGSLAPTFAAESGTEPPALHAFQPAETEGRMTVEQLHELLRLMGYHAELNSNAGGATYVRMTIDGGSVDVAPSPDQTTLWITVFLAKLPADAPAARLLTVLEESRHGRTRFAVRNGFLCLQYSIPNGRVTAFDLREMIDHAMAAVDSTRDVWDTASWSKTSELAGK